jgi:hypothetical protein
LDAARQPLDHLGIRHRHLLTRELGPNQVPANPDQSLPELRKNSGERDEQRARVLHPRRHLIQWPAERFRRKVGDHPVEGDAHGGLVDGRSRHRGGHRHRLGDVNWLGQRLRLRGGYDRLLDRQRPLWCGDRRRLDPRREPRLRDDALESCDGGRYRWPLDDRGRPGLGDDLGSRAQCRLGLLERMERHRDPIETRELDLRGVRDEQLVRQLAHHLVQR